MAGRKTNQFHSYLSQARADKVQLGSSSIRDVQKSAGNVGTSVVNAEGDGAVILQIGHSDLGPERKGAVSSYML